MQCHAWLEEIDPPIHQPPWRWYYSYPATHDLQYQVQYKPKNEIISIIVIIDTIQIKSIKHIIDIIHIINFVCLSLVFESHIPENVADEMNYVLVH